MTLNGAAGRRPSCSPQYQIEYGRRNKGKVDLMLIQAWKKAVGLKWGKWPPTGRRKGLS